MIGYNETIATKLDRTFRVVRMQDGFQDQRLVQLITQPGEVIPVWHLCHPAIEYQTLPGCQGRGGERGFQIDCRSGLRPTLF